MEVTTVSPPPTSPTEGDNVSEIDVTNVAIHSVTLLICLSGLAGNGALIFILKLEEVVYGIFCLAVEDFIFLLFTVPSALLFLLEDVSCSPIMPLLFASFIFQLSFISYFWALYRLIPRSTVGYIRKLFCRCKFPLRLQWMVDSAQYWAFFALFTVIPSLTSLCPSHEHGNCWAALFSMYAIILLLFVAPMLISSTMDIIKAKWGSQQQQPKRRNIVIFIIVLLTVLLSICNFLQRLGYTIVPSQVVFLLTCIHSSIKPFIYFLAGRCWWPCSVQSLRNSLQRVFEEQNEKTARRNDDSVDTVV